MSPPEPRDRPSDGAATDGADDLRPPKAVLWRALLVGVGAGGLLGALMGLPPDVGRSLSESDASFAVTWWSWLVVTVPIGASVGFLPALLAVAVWEWQRPRGVRRARLAGSGAAALAVVATAALFQLLTAVALVLVAAAVSFAVAYLSVPLITTTRRRPRRTA